MKNNGLGITAFAIVILAVIATLAMIAFSDGIRKVGWMDLESMALACFGLSILGCVLGWCAFRYPLGKISAILGTIVVAGFLLFFLRPDAHRTREPGTDEPPRAIE
ncbi:MAG: hypothetical protein V1809_16570 [Planctomycetota bacterium]